MRWRFNARLFSGADRFTTFSGRSRHDSDVVLHAWIDFEVIRELTAEAGHLDRLSLTQAAHIDTRRSANEYVHVTRTVVNDNDEPKRQIVDDRLRDRSRDTNDTALGCFAYASGSDRLRLHLWTTPVSLCVRHVDKHEQARQHSICERAGHAHLLPQRESEIVRRADVDAAGTILDSETLIEGARAECA